jgi:hypothetical protein
MTKIIKLPIRKIDIAGYDLDTDTVYYDRELDKYPRLKKLVIAHELLHAKYQLALFNHIWLDIKTSVTLPFRYDFFEYAVIAKHIPRNKKPRNKKQDRLMAHYGWFNVFRVILELPIVIMATLINMGKWAAVKIHGKHTKEHTDQVCRKTAKSVHR